MSNTMMKLTNYEKKALRSFGCPDTEMTIYCLYCVAHMTIHEEDREKLIRLAEKVRDVVFNSDFIDEFFANAGDLDHELMTKTVACANDTGVPFPGKPWKKYLKAQIVNSFCNENRRASLFRLKEVEEVAVPGCVRDCLLDVMDTVADFPSCGPRKDEYGKYLTACREIVHTAANRKKKGKISYYSYVWKELADEQTENDEV